MIEKIKPYIITLYESRIEYIKADTNSIEINICSPLRSGEVRIVSTAVK